MSETRLLILGAGRFAADVADWAADIDGVTPIGFYQDSYAESDQSLDALPILSEQQLRAELPRLRFIAAIGSPERRVIIDKLAGWGAQFTTIIHPSALVSPRAQLGEGTIVAPFSHLAAHAVLGTHVIVNRSASIGHHVEIGDYSFVGPNATIAGSALLSSRAVVGAGAVVRDGTRIGEGATVGVGSVAARDVSAGTTVFGIPAKPLPPQ